MTLTASAFDVSYRARQARAWWRRLTARFAETLNALDYDWTLAVMKWRGRHFPTPLQRFHRAAIAYRDSAAARGVTWAVAYDVARHVVRGVFERGITEWGRGGLAPYAGEAVRYALSPGASLEKALEQVRVVFAAPTLPMVKA